MQVAINQQTEREICFEISLQIRVINNKHVVQFGESAAAQRGGRGGARCERIARILVGFLRQHWARGALRHSHSHVQHVLSFGRARYYCNTAALVVYSFTLSSLQPGAHLAGL